MTPDDEARALSPFLRAVHEALTHAGNLAVIASESFNGQQGAVLFHEMALSIYRLRDEDPAVIKVRTAAIPPSMFKKDRR